MIICAYAIGLAQRDLHKLRLEGGSIIDEMVGAIRRRREVVRLIKHGTLLCSGLITAHWRIIEGYTYLPVISIYATSRFGMTFVSFLMFLETVWERYDRFIIERMSKAEYEQAQQNHHHRRKTDGPQPPKL